ncbi:hypothetical protein BH20CHL6_BH20CHL6_06580 [soil metagenome]
MRGFDCACGEYVEAENDGRLLDKMRSTPTGITPTTDSRTHSCARWPTPPLSAPVHKPARPDGDCARKAT